MTRESENEPGLLKKWFWNTYDYLGTLIVVNVLWLVFMLPLVTLPLAFAGLFRVTGRIAAYESTDIRDFFTLSRQEIIHSIRLCALYASALFLLSANVMFYVRLMDSWPWVGAFLSGVMLWVMAFIALTAVYTFPLMHQRSRSVMENIRSGIFLVMDNTKHSIGVLVSGFLIMVFSLISGVGVFFLGIGAAAVLMSTGLREVLKRYDSTDDKGIGEEARGWRDLLRPWGDS